MHRHDASKTDWGQQNLWTGLANFFLTWAQNKNKTHISACEESGVSTHILSSCTLLLADTEMVGSLGDTRIQVVLVFFCLDILQKYIA